MLKTKRILITTFLFNLLTSCVFIPKPYETPWADSIHIHDNPKPGDYAVIADNKGMAHYHWKVEDVRGDEIEVSMRVDIHAMGVSHDFQQHFVVNRQGKTLRGWVKYDDGSKYKRPIAKPGRMGSREQFQKVDKIIEKKIKTEAGEFAIDEVYSYILNIDLGLASTRSTNFDNLSNKVPFRLVRSYQISSVDVGALLTAMEVIALGGSASLTGNYTEVYNYATGSNKDAVKVDLVEYGWGK